MIRERRAIQQCTFREGSEMAQDLVLLLKTGVWVGVTEQRCGRPEGVRT